MNGSDLLLYDLTAVFYYDQIGVVMAFSSSDSIPWDGCVLWFRKGHRHNTDFLERLPETKGIGFIFDRGFSSYKQRSLPLPGKAHTLGRKKDKIRQPYIRRSCLKG